MRQLACTISTAAVAIAALITPALAAPLSIASMNDEPKMEVAGTLTCQVAPGLGLGVGSSRPGTCIFDHIGAQGFSETYDSRLERMGFDVGLMGSQSFKLTVLTPNGDATPGMLAGNHRGQSSERSLVKTAGLKMTFRGEGSDVAFEQSGESSWVGLGVGSGRTTLNLANPRAM